MLKEALRVRDEVVRKCQGRQIDLETVTAVIGTITAIDEIVYVEVDIPLGNPIVGRFRRYARFPGTYAGALTLAEIEYAKHLSEPWLRYVVTKESCHALGAAEGEHMVSDTALANLVVLFSIKSATGQIQEFDPNMHLETLAEICAIEILCPWAERQKILAENRNPDPGKMAAHFNIPVQIAGLAFSKAYIQLVEWLSSNNH